MLDNARQTRLDPSSTLSRIRTLKYTRAAPRGARHLLRDALERSGSAVDRKGDGLACGAAAGSTLDGTTGRPTARSVAMTRAVAIGHEVVQGDKEKPELTDMINTTCAVDLAELARATRPRGRRRLPGVQGGRAAHHEEPPHGQRFGAACRRRPPLRFR